MRCARPECGRQRPAGAWRTSGITVDDVWYCSARCVHGAGGGFVQHEPLTMPPQLPKLKLGSLLMHQRAVTPEVLECALAAQHDSGLPLGAELQRLGVRPVSILRALAAQQGVDFLTTCDVASVHGAPGGLHPDTVRTLRVVPFEADADRGHLKVACQAPVPRRSLEALRRLTGWTAEPFLVSDDMWEQLAANYGRRQNLRRQPVTRCDAGDATRRAAMLAERGPGVRVLQARCDPFTWVRLEGTTGVEDLFIPHPAVPKEELCRRAPTSH